jgi:two-component system, NarL family, sensor histidine kinase UhpB
MSLRLFLISLIAALLAASLVLGGMIASFNASRSVQTEMRSALAVGQQMIEANLAGLDRSLDPKRDLEESIASFKGNRHLRVSLVGDGDAVTTPTVEEPPLGKVPSWFVQLLNVPSTTIRIPVVVGGRNFGTVLIESDPHNEILEIWDEFGDGLFVLALFFVATVLLVYFFIGRALRPLDRLAAGLSRIGRGDYSARLDGKLPPELSRLRDSFNRMAGQLAEMAGENQRLNEQLLTLQEEERNDIAHDLHDEIGPFLFAINVDAANITRRIDEGRVGTVKELVQSIVEAVAHMQRQVRSMLRLLRPIGLAEFGLDDAIGNLVEFWRRRYPDIAYEIEISSESESFGDLVDPIVYRVVQESLSNAVRHSHPTRIRVGIEGRRADDSRGAVVVTVADNGQGMAEPTGIGPAGTGYGLLGMSERVKAMGGTLTIASRPGQGTAVIATLPYTAEHSGEGRTAGLKRAIGS